MYVVISSFSYLSFSIHCCAEHTDGVATFLVDDGQVRPRLAQVWASLENYVDVPMVITDIGGPSPALRESK